MSITSNNSNDLDPKYTTSRIRGNNHITVGSQACTGNTATGSRSGQC